MEFFLSNGEKYQKEETIWIFFIFSGFVKRITMSRIETVGIVETPGRGRVGMVLGRVIIRPSKFNLYSCKGE